MEARELVLVVLAFQLAVGLEITLLLLGHWLPPQIPHAGDSVARFTLGHSTLKVGSGQIRAPMAEAPPPTAQSALDRTAAQSNAPTARPRSRFNPRAAIAGVLSLAIIGLAIWYLARPEPLLVQGEVESTRIDMAARVSGRLAKIAVVRGQDETAGTTLLVIDNPELVAQLHEAEAEKLVADAELARINVGTRSEVVAQ